MNNSERQRQWQEKNIAEGKCRQCGRPKPDGVQRCKACRDKANARYIKVGSPRGRKPAPQYAVVQKSRSKRQT